MNQKEIIVAESQDEMQIQLVQVFNRVQVISDEMRAAKEKGDKAKEKAQSVQTGRFKSKTKAVEDLKDVAIMNADTSIATLELVDKVSENQQRMIEACNEFVKIGAIDLASNRAVIEFIERTMRGGAERTLTEETKLKLIEVIRELKEKADISEKQKRQARKINEHESRLKNVENHAEETDRKFDASERVDERQDRTLNLQNDRLDRSEATDEKHDQQLYELEERIETLNKHVLSLESEIDVVKKQRENKGLLIVSIILASIGLIIGVINLVI